MVGFTIKLPTHTPRGLAAGRLGGINEKQWPNYRKLLLQTPILVLNGGHTTLKGSYKGPQLEPKAVQKKFALGFPKTIKIWRPKCEFV